MGRSGTAYSILTREELPYLLDLHLYLGRAVEAAPLIPDAADITAQVSPAADVQWCGLQWHFLKSLKKHVLLRARAHQQAAGRQAGRRQAGRGQGAGEVVCAMQLL